MRRGRVLLACLLLLAGAASTAQAGWIWAKALLAQHLMRTAWQKTLDGEERVRPWPWADTFPVARLVAPRHGVDLIVLDGVSGRSLAFGPGYLNGSAAPGTAGNTVLAGHRDTHFRFLASITPGEELRLETPAGEVRSYRVKTARVVDENDPHATDPAGPSRLTLVTCFPFDAVVPGGPLRYVVTAEPAPPGAGAPMGRRPAAVADARTDKPGPRLARSRRSRSL